MSKLLPAALDSRPKPSWQAPAAAAGAMAAGLMVGRSKSTMGLVLGMAAMAGARWMMTRRGKDVAAGTSENKSSQESGAVPAMSEPVLGNTKESISTKPAAATEAPPVMIYEQPEEMPSSSAAQAGTVWFALFNEAPQVKLETPHEAGASAGAPPSGDAPVSAATPEKEDGTGGLFEEGPMPDSFFSEAPGVEPSSEAILPVEVSPPVAVSPDGCIEVQAETMSAKPSAVLDSPVEKVELTHPVILGKAQGLAGVAPFSLRQIVAKPLMEPAERVSRPLPPFPVLFPQKRPHSEQPLWIAPAPEKQVTLHSKKSDGTVAVHRSIVPHEALAEPKAPRRWPLVTAMMVLFLALTAFVVVGAGLDGGRVKEWKERWMNFHPATTVTDDDVGLWSRKGSKMVSSPRAGQ